MKASAFSFKRFLWISSLSLAVLLSPLPSLALTVQEVPNPRQTYNGWVTDMADILKPDTEYQINQIINQLEAKNGAEIAVVTVPETSPAASPKEFTTKLFNYWKIGKKGKDNGVLFLVSVKDRRVEIETGYGVEEILPDAKVGNIIDTQIIPKFKQKDFDGGVLTGTKAVVVILEPSVSKNLAQETSRLNQETSNFDDDQTDWYGNILFVIIMVIICLHKSLNREILDDFQIVSGLIKYKIFGKPIFLEPAGHSQTKYWNKWLENTQNVKCLKCKQPMQQLESTLIKEWLTKPEKIAEDLGGTELLGWQCTHCSPDKIHIRAYERPNEILSKCPHCQALTIIKGEPQTVREQGIFQAGLLSIPYDCKCCNYHQDIEISISSGSDSSGGSSSGGGGGSFGGGDSGGGGAGGSW